MPDGTSGYQEKLSTARSLPQESVTEKNFKHEQARNLRINNYLAWASIAFESVMAIIENPHIEKSALKKKLERFVDNVNRPEIAISLIHQMVEERKVVNQTLDLFRQQSALPKTEDKIGSWSEKDKLTVGSEIFKSVTGKKPKGEVILQETAFGVCILTRNDADFEIIFGGETQAKGHYSIRKQKVGGQEIQFPLVYVRSGNSQQYIYHESNHLTHNLIIKTLEEFGLTGQQWGGKTDWKYPQAPFASVDEFNDFAEKEMANYAIMAGKDEVLADFLASGSFGQKWQT